MSHRRVSAGALFTLPETRASLMVHAGIAGMQTYFSTGVSTLVAIMAAHRIAATEGEPAALQAEIDRISATLNNASGRDRGC